MSGKFAPIELAFRVKENSKKRKLRESILELQKAQKGSTRMTQEQRREALETGLHLIYGEMRQKPVKPKQRKNIDWEAVCERTRRRCSQLSDEERRRYRDEALRTIYSANAKAAARSRCHKRADAVGPEA